MCYFKSVCYFKRGNKMDCLTVGHYCISHVVLDTTSANMPYIGYVHDNYSLDIAYTT